MTIQQEPLVEFDNSQQEDQLFQLNLGPKSNNQVKLFRLNIEQTYTWIEITRISIIHLNRY